MQKKIKIAYIIDKLEIGGTEKQLLKTIEFLNRDNFESTLICLRPSDYFSSLDLQCEKYVLNVFSLISIHGFLKFLWLASYLRKESIDLVQTYFFDATAFGILAAKLACVRMIISCRRDLGFWYTPNILRILRFINMFVDRFLVNSRAVKENIRVCESVPSQKIDVIYNGIDIERLKESYDAKAIKRHLGIRDTDYVVGMIANLNRPVKRVDVFIKAASKVLENKNNVCFVVVGDGNQRNDLERLSQKLNLQEKLYFAGVQENIYPYLTAFDIGVISSDSEGFSNSLLEYIASGVPVVATDNAGNRELLRNGGLGNLVPTGDPDKMADSIVELLNDSYRKKIVSRNAKELAKQEYGWEVKIKEIERYYRTILGTR